MHLYGSGPLSSYASYIIWIRAGKCSAERSTSPVRTEGAWSASTSTYSGLSSSTSRHSNTQLSDCPITSTAPLPETSGGSMEYTAHKACTAPPTLGGGTEAGHGVKGIARWTGPAGPCAGARGPRANGLFLTGPPGLRILVAEDNAINQKVIAKVLHKVLPDCRPCMVNNGREALEVR